MLLRNESSIEWEDRESVTVGCLVGHISMAEFKFWFCSQFQLPADVLLGGTGAGSEWMSAALVGHLNYFSTSSSAWPSSHNCRFLEVNHPGTLLSLSVI